MNDRMMLFLFGSLFLIVGIVCLLREKRLYRDSLVTTAKLTNYYEYRAQHNNATMYSMEVEYKTEEGTLIHAREQGATNHPKYKIGAEFEIFYSGEKPEIFRPRGDHSRTIAFGFMAVLGLALIAAAFYLLLGGAR